MARSPICKSKNTNRRRLLLSRLEDRAVPAIFTVTNTMDGPSGSAPVGSLRWAIDQANAAAGDDTVNFDATFNSPQTIPLTNNQLIASDALTITGPGKDNLTIDCQKLSFGFLFSKAGSATFTLSGVTLANGVAGVNGGGIAVGGSDLLNLNDSVVRDCSAGNSGGGIAIGFDGALSVLRSTISGNTSGTDPISKYNYRSGGGIYFLSGATLSVIDSTISGNNSPQNLGGGIYAYGALNGTGITIRNSTITGNSSAGSVSGGGGGIQLYNSNAGSMTIRNSTIFQNTTGGYGGGVSVFGSATASIESTVIANNIAASANDFDGTVKANFSLIRNQTGTTLSPGSGSNLLAGTDPMLTTFTGTDGMVTWPTKVWLPDPSSPLKNAGSNPTPTISFDQRGAGFTRSVGQTDIGAVEIQAAGIPNRTSNPPNVTAPTAAPYVFTVVYTDDTAISITSLKTGNVTVTGPNSFTTNPNFVSSSGTGTSVTATYSFTPPGVTMAWDSGDNGTYQLSVGAIPATDTSANPVPGGVINTFQSLIPTTFVVTNANDDLNPGSLRRAISDANAFASIGDSITFDAKAFSTPQAITLTLGAITISDSVTIIGPGQGLVSVSGNKASRVFVVDGADTLDVSISGLTITNGNNTAIAGIGGAITLQDENLTLIDCTVSNSTAAFTGGGIGVAAKGNLVLTRTSVSGNSAVQDGGGVYFYNGGDLTVQDSTISNNTTSATLFGGGGIYFFGAVNDGVVNIRNSTISGNTSNTLDGGGICIRTFGGELLIENSTVTANSAGGSGGGIAQVSGGTAKITLVSSVVAGNLTNSSFAADVFSAGEVVGTTSGIGDVSGISGTQTFDSTTTNLVGSPNFKLGSLANNGGFTKTHALLAGSVLLNAGSNPASLKTDQRGYNRAVGTIDIGAFEVQPAPTVTLKVDNGTAQRSMVRSLTLTFSGIVTLPGTPATAFSLDRTGPTSNGPTWPAPLPTAVGAVGLNVAQSTNASALNSIVTLTFTGGLTDLLSGSLTDGFYNFAALAGSITDPSGQLLNGGTNFTTPAAPLPGPSQVGYLYRLFGDSNGDRKVDSSDFIQFRNTFNQNANVPPGNPLYNGAFDFNSDGKVDSSDFIAFRGRFNSSLP